MAPREPAPAVDARALGLNSVASIAAALVSSALGANELTALAFAAVAPALTMYISGAGGWSRGLRLSGVTVAIAFAVAVTTLTAPELLLGDAFVADRRLTLIPVAADEAPAPRPTPSPTSTPAATPSGKLIPHGKRLPAPKRRAPSLLDALPLDPWAPEPSATEPKRPAARPRRARPRTGG